MVGVRRERGRDRLGHPMSTWWARRWEVVRVVGGLSPDKGEGRGRDGTMALDGDPLSLLPFSCWGGTDDSRTDGSPQAVVAPVDACTRDMFPLPNCVHDRGSDLNPGTSASNKAHGQVQPRLASEFQGRSLSADLGVPLWIWR